jgi:hypothetical protein
MAGAIANKEKYGDDYIGDAIYFNFLFLQFVPFTFIIVFVILFIFYRFVRKSKL